MACTERKLIVEVVEAHDLLPKDGTGTSSPYVVVDFDGQRRRTQTAYRDLNPTWNEALEFNVAGGMEATAGEPLEIDVFHDRKVGPSRRSNFLGRVRLDARHFVRKGEEALIHFPLEKKSFFSWVRGEIGLRIYYVDKPVEEPAATTEKAEETAAPPPVDGGAPAPPPPPTEPAAADGEIAPPPTEPAAADGEIAPPPTKPAVADGEVAPPPPAAEAPPTAEAEPEQQTAPPPPELQEGEGDAKKPPESEPSPPPLEIGTETGVDQPSESSPQPSGTEALLPLPSPEFEKETVPKWVAQPEPRPMHRQPLPAPERTPDTIERSSYDLVDKMQYLFIRVVRARSLPGSAKPHVRVVAYGRHVSTRTARRAAFFEWDQTFAFARDPASAAGDSTLEISVWDLPPDADVDVAGEKRFLGGVCFDVSEVHIRDPPDSPLATQWYRLESGAARTGDLMLATWVGTQADQSFPDAWKADAPPGLASSRSKIYLSPKLWYLRATILEAQDTVNPSRELSVSVRATLGLQVLKTRPAVTRNTGPSWNEELIFVAAEPFGEDQNLIVWLETRHGKETVVLGSAGIPLSSIERRVDDRKVASRWLDLNSGEETKKARRSSSARTAGGRLHVRVCLDGGYHVSDEPSHAISDFRPSARQLWRPPAGAVELGIIGCKNLLPMRTVDGKGTTDAFAVAKYGPKWARTRTVASSFDPSWNEQYTWPVYDPCTVLTVAVFDESDGSAKDSTTCRPMGKIRIRISTLESNRAYRGVYPLVLMLPSGAKRMGEIELAVRFARAGSSLDLLQIYTQPMLPPMHHLRPIPAALREPLRQAAARLVAGHLARSEPSLRREVVMWMLENGEPRGFSMRRVRANWHRIVTAMGWATEAVRWVDDTRRWRNPTATVLAHGVLVLVVWHPDLVVPAVALHVFGLGAWRYRRRPRDPAPHPCVRASMAEGAAEREELEEEFDPVPTARGPEAVRARYERMRAVGARVQAVLGDVAAQAERVQAMVTWRDPRATGMFIGWCLMVAVVLYAVPAKMVAVASGFYFLRHPMFRNRMPPPALNFFRRLPAMSDRIL